MLVSKSKYSVFLCDLLKKKSMTNVKVRLKYFYAVSEIIMLLRENNRPSRVKGYLQEAGLFTHMPSWIQRVEQNVNS